MTVAERLLHIEPMTREEAEVIFATSGSFELFSRLSESKRAAITSGRDKLRRALNPQPEQKRCGGSGEDQVCYSCGEPAAGACPNSKRPCGHHCNCSWTNDRCHWCGKEWGEDSSGTRVAEAGAGDGSRLDSYKRSALAESVIRCLGQREEEEAQLEREGRQRAEGELEFAKDRATKAEAALEELAVEFERRAEDWAGTSRPRELGLKEAATLCRERATEVRGER